MIIFVIFSTIYYEIVLENVHLKEPFLIQLHHERVVLITSNDEKEIRDALAKADAIFNEIEQFAENLYFSFLFVEVLNIMNMTFFMQQLVQFFVIKKLGRFQNFPTFVQLIDLILFCVSGYTFYWIQTAVMHDLHAPGISLVEFHQRVISNFEDIIGFKFQYLFSLQVFCLILRIAVLLEYNESIGPLLRIVFKMSQDFFNFMCIFFLLIIMFGVVGNLNFMGINHFENFYESMLTVIDFAIGNFDFKFFDNVDD